MSSNNNPNIKVEGFIEEIVFKFTSAEKPTEYAELKIARPEGLVTVRAFDNSGTVPDLRRDARKGGYIVCGVTEREGTGNDGGTIIFRNLASIISVVGPDAAPSGSTPAPATAPSSNGGGYTPQVDRQDAIMLQHATAVSERAYASWIALPAETRGTFSDYLKNVAQGGLWLLDKHYKVGGYKPQPKEEALPVPEEPPFQFEEPPFDVETL